MSPRASARQHEHDRGEDRAIVDRCAATALRPDGELWNQRFDHLPQGIRHQTQRQIIHHEPYYVPHVTSPT